MADGDNTQPEREPAERVTLNRPTERDVVLGSGRAVEKGYQLLVDQPAPMNMAPADSGPPVDLPPDPPAGGGDE